MEKEVKIIIADTNWWISLLIKNFNNQFALLLLSPKFQFVSSDELTGEIKDTLKKQRLQKYFNPGQVENFWYQFNALVTTVSVTSTVSICRDPNDNFLLALAKDSLADFLITGDKDLLVLGLFENTIICTLTDFIDKYLIK
jgi:putative PIN family toxin of toxin-antitoxin system